MSVASFSTRVTGTVAIGKAKPRSVGKAAPSNSVLDISKVGWSNLEGKFNELMELLDSPTLGINALEARTQHRNEVQEVIRALLDKAQDECRNLLIQGSGEAAEEAGVKLLRLRERFYGPKHLQLLPAYLHLARARQFMERYGDAEDMLSLANYIAQKNQANPELTMATKAELHQTYGLLYAADEKFDIAVKHLTCATYYMSCLHGPQSILTTFSYFDLGNVFAAKACMESAMAMYDNVKEIWHAHLCVVLNEAVAERAAAEKMRRYVEDEAEQEPEGYASTRAFGADNLVDASKMLHGIFAIQKERYRVDHPSTARAQLVLGMFLLWVSDETEAASHLSGAYASLQKFYGSRYPVVAEVEEWCGKFGFTVVDEAAGEEGDEHDKVAEQGPEPDSVVMEMSPAEEKEEGGKEDEDDNQHST